MKHNKTALLAIVLALVTAIALFTGCKKAPLSPTESTPMPQDTDKPAVPRDDDERVVTLAQASDPNTLDPQKASADIGANVNQNICETLFRFTGSYELVPLLAESFEQLGENEWVVHLKKNITFSNGEPFDAEAVIWNLERANSKEYPRQAFQFRNYYDHAEVIDPYTVKIITITFDEKAKQHFGEVPMLAPKYSTEIGEDALNSDIIGTGPYILESWKKDQQIVLKAREDYWGGVPEVKKYIIKTIPEAATRIAELLTGSVDIIYNVNFEDLDMLSKQQNVKIDKMTTRSVGFLSFNTVDWSPAPELKDKRVRLAMNYAVDVKAIIDNVLGGYAHELPTVWREDFEPYDLEGKGLEYNPEKAKELLKDAGYENGFTIKCQVADGLFPKAIEITQAVASYLAKVNITMEVLPLEFNTLDSIIINGQEQKKAEGMFFWSWAGKPHDYDATLMGYLHSTGMSSYNAVPGYDELIDSIMTERDSAKKTELLKRFQQMLLNDPPCLYLFQQVSIYGFSDRVDCDLNAYNRVLAKDIKFHD